MSSVAFLKRLPSLVFCAAVTGCLAVSCQSPSYERSTPVSGLPSTRFISLGNIRRDGWMLSERSWVEHYRVSRMAEVNCVLGAIESGETVSERAFPASGFFCRLILLDDSTNAHTMISISRAYSIVTKAEVAGDLKEFNLSGSGKTCQYNPALVGLVYGLLVREKFEVIEALRKVYRQLDGERNTIEENLFDPSYAERLRRCSQGLHQVQEPLSASSGATGKRESGFQGRTLR